MKNKLILVLIAILIMYIPGLLGLNLNLIWIFLLLISYIVLFIIFGKNTNPRVILYTMVIGILLSRILSWTIYITKYDIAPSELVKYFFEGNAFSYSLIGVFIGYILVRLYNFKRES